MAKITTITLTYNEEEDIERCLKSLSWADECIVMDSFSSDSTIEKARPYCSRVVQGELVDFSSIRNKAIKEAGNEWILMVDADEVIPDELADEITRAVENDDFAGYRINRINYMYNIKLNYDQPDYQLKLFRRDKTFYRNKVHEEPQVDGDVSTLAHSLFHYSMKDLSDHTDKMNMYTDLASLEPKENIIKSSIRPFYRLMQILLLQRSYRDGIVGIVMALNAFFYEFLLLFKVWEKRYIKK